MISHSSLFSIRGASPKATFYLSGHERYQDEASATLLTLEILHTIAALTGQVSIATEVIDFAELKAAIQVVNTPLPRAAFDHLFTIALSSDAVSIEMLLQDEKDGPQRV